MGRAKDSLDSKEEEADESGRAPMEERPRKSHRMSEGERKLKIGWRIEATFGIGRPGSTMSSVGGGWGFPSGEYEEHHGVASVSRRKLSANLLDVIRHVAAQGHWCDPAGPYSGSYEWNVQVAPLLRIGRLSPGCRIVFREVWAAYLQQYHRRIAEAVAAFDRSSQSN